MNSTSVEFDLKPLLSGSIWHQRIAFASEFRVVRCFAASLQFCFQLIETKRRHKIHSPSFETEVQRLGKHRR